MAFSLSCADCSSQRIGTTPPAAPLLLAPWMPTRVTSWPASCREGNMPDAHVPTRTQMHEGLELTLTFIPRRYARAKTLSWLSRPHLKRFQPSRLLRFSRQQSRTCFSCWQGAIRRGPFLANDIALLASDSCAGRMPAWQNVCCL